MCALLLFAGAWFWVQARIYEQLKQNHPLIFTQLSEPPAPIGSGDPDTRAACFALAVVFALVARRAG